MFSTGMMFNFSNDINQVFQMIFNNNLFTVRTELKKILTVVPLSEIITLGLF